MKKVLLFIGLLIIFNQGVALAYTECLFTWNPNTEPDLASYKLYNTNNPGVSVLTVNAPATSVTLPVASCGIGDSFYVTAVDLNGNESTPSNTVFVLDTEAPNAPTGLSVTIQ